MDHLASPKMREICQLMSEYVRKCAAAFSVFDIQMFE